MHYGNTHRSKRRVLRFPKELGEGLNKAECASVHRMGEEQTQHRERERANEDQKEESELHQNIEFDLEAMEETIRDIERTLNLESLAGSEPIFAPHGRSHSNHKETSPSALRPESRSSPQIEDDDAFFKADSLDIVLNLPQRSCTPTDSTPRSSSPCTQQQWAQSMSSSPRLNGSAYSRSGSLTPFLSHSTAFTDFTPQSAPDSRRQHSWSGTAGNGARSGGVPQAQCMEGHPVPTVPDFATLGMAEVLGMGLTLREILDFGLLCRFTADRAGSKYIQQILWSLGAADRVHAVEGIVRRWMAIQVDWAQIAQCRFGHHLVGRLFEFGSAAQRQLLLELFVKRSVLRLSCSEFGCRFVQNVVARMVGAEREGLVRSLREQCASKEVMGNVLCSRYASFVLQGIIAAEMPFASVAFIASALEQNLGALWLCSPAVLGVHALTVCHHADSCSQRISAGISIPAASSRRWSAATASIWM